MFDENKYRQLDEDEQHKELYAYFGLTIYQFQVVEHQLLNMILGLRKAENLDMSTEEYDKIFYENSDKTLGQLIKRVNRVYNLSKKDRKTLEMICQRRNFVAHHFFKEDIHKTFTVDGRVEMIKELVSYFEKSKELDISLMSYINEYMKKCGLTDKLLNDIVDKTIKNGIKISDTSFKKQ